MIVKSHTISRLVSIWYTVIGGLHHKDRDCWFRIAAVWSYDGRLEYEIQHDGYLMQAPLRTFHTYVDAEEVLIDLLKNGIREWINCDDSLLTPVRCAELRAEMEAL